jgi:hypothetical protein
MAALGPDTVEALDRMARAAVKPTAPAAALDERARAVVVVEATSCRGQVGHRSDPPAQHSAEPSFTVASARLRTSPRTIDPYALGESADGRRRVPRAGDPEMDHREPFEPRAKDRGFDLGRILERGRPGRVSRRGQAQPLLGDDVADLRHGPLHVPTVLGEGLDVSRALDEQQPGGRQPSPSYGRVELRRPDRQRGRNVPARRPAEEPTHAQGASRRAA